MYSRVLGDLEVRTFESELVPNLRSNHLVFMKQYMCVCVSHLQNQNCPFCVFVHMLCLSVPAS